MFSSLPVYGRRRYFPENILSHRLMLLGCADKVETAALFKMWSRRCFLKRHPQVFEIECIQRSASSAGLGSITVAKLSFLVS
jgi:hypothetical protein